MCPWPCDVKRTSCCRERGRYVVVGGHGFGVTPDVLEPGDCQGSLQLLCGSWLCLLLALASVMVREFPYRSLVKRRTGSWRNGHQRSCHLTYL